MISFTSTLEIKPYCTQPHLKPEERKDTHICTVAGQILAYCDTREEAELVRDEYQRTCTRLRLEQHAKETRDINVDAVFASLAQGVVNIDSGLTTIEAGSRVHRAMSLLCALRTDGIL